MINENENIQDPEMNNSEENVEQGSAATEELTNKLNESNDKYARLNYVFGLSEAQDFCLKAEQICGRNYHRDAEIGCGKHRDSQSQQNNRDKIDNFARQF